MRVAEQTASGANKSALLSLDLDPAKGNQRSGALGGVKPGQTISLAVYAEGVKDMTGFAVGVEYDTSRVFYSGADAETIDEKNVLASQGGTMLFVKQPPRGNVVSIGGALLSPTATTAPDAGGLLGVVKFKALEGFTSSGEFRIPRVLFRSLAGQDTVEVNVSASVSAEGGSAPPAGALTPKAGNGMGMLDLDPASGDQKLRTKYSVKAGDKVDVQILFSKETANATGFSAVLGFDPAKLTVAGGKGDGAFATAIFPGPPQVKADSVTYAGSFLGSSTTLNGSVAILSFQTGATFTGETEITLKTLTVRAAGVATTYQPGASVVLSSSSGTSGKPTPDFTGDGEVGFDDFFEFAGAFGQPATGANAKYDLDGDGDVGFGDFFEFAGAFGTTIKAAKTALALPGVNASANLSVVTSSSGERLTVTLAASGVSQIRGYRLVMSYDPSVLAFVKAERSPDAMLSRAGSTPLFLARQTAPGRVVLADAAIGGTASGSGILANLIFQKIGPGGDSAFKVDLAQVFDSKDGINILPMKTEAIPVTYAMSQNYPNPFNPETRISYSLPESGPIRLSVYNLLGQAVRSLVNRTQAAGQYEVRWDGRDDAGRLLAGGIYLCRIEARGFTKVRKMVFIK
jgi:hypothetical protein